ncbi:MAG: type IV pilus modification protein PilV [Gallionella sp.]|nr:type IV pilus modification protein PilV [Gallionella sp.]MDD4945328.1 type IV pilus modification protein PilV [Gallionella sp.]MDD5612675.1 type IV pilus modification protein PilV [Gallionella sp.]
MQNKSAQQGAVLLEALIAFLIFSMGLLGVIGLQATAINNTLDARYRSDAAFLANQVIAQMWADSQANTATVPTTYTIKPSYACNPCTKANGNANTQAWVSQIQSGFLPGVSDTTNQPVIAINGNQVTVTMNWQSPQGDKQTHNYITKTEIQFN